tara:strand:+ start:727 stop:861 length:135 start_codon:yes stop_codon:yes gene_type:complete
MSFCVKSLVKEKIKQKERINDYQKERINDYQKERINDYQKEIKL